MKKGKNSGFTLLELLIVIAIIAVLVAIVLAGIGVSRAKAEDGKTRTVLNNARSSAAEEYNTAQSYSSICASGKVYEVVSNLANQRNLTTGEYYCIAGAQEYVVAFPLKAQEGYWCIDSFGNAKQIASPPSQSGIYSCNNLSSQSQGGGDTPVIYLTTPTGIPGSRWPFDEYLTVVENMSNWGPDVWFSATDTEDGDITSQVQIQTFNDGQWYDTNTYLKCDHIKYRMVYTITDSDNNSNETEREVRDFTNQSREEDCQYSESGPYTQYP